MRILGIDPGYERMGVAVVERIGTSKETLLYSSCVTTPKTVAHDQRLLLIAEAIESLLGTYKPEVVAFEKLFFNTNQKTALMVAEARGVAIALSAKAGAKIFEYTPQQIKVAVTGHGGSDKSQVMKMIPKLVTLNISQKRHDDEYDAIAVALTCFASEKFR